MTMDSKQILKILVVCQYYFPENFQVNDICEELVNRGHHVTVLTGLPNYPTGEIPEEYRNGKKRDEEIKGVKVLRSFEIARKKGIVGLALNYLSYSISASLKIRKLPKDYDIIYIHQLSPIFMAIPGILYKRHHNVPLILYCCDIWPESLKLMIKTENSVVFKLVKNISKIIYNKVDRLIVQTKYFYPYFQTVHGIALEKMTYLPQFSKSIKLPNTLKASDTFNFVFTGNIGIAQNLDKVLEAVEKLKYLNNFKVHIVGDGSCLDMLKKMVVEKDIQDKVIFYGRRPAEEMGQYYQLADACIVSLDNQNLTGLTLPVKVQAYMAAGKTILGMCDGATKEVIENSKCGICVPAGDSLAFSRAMFSMITNPRDYDDCGNNGQIYFQEKFTFTKFIDNLENIMKEMIF